MKKFLLLIFIILCFLPSSMIAQEIEWQNTIGGSDMEHLNSIEQTLDGGYILGGYSSSNISGDKSENSYGGYDYWIVKIDSLGILQWQNTIGGNNDDKLYSISQTTDGGFILGGFSSSDATGDKTENSIGSYDYWIIKTDAFGNIQWQNTIGGSSSDELYSIRQTSDGGYILGGHSSSNISGDKAESSLGGSDYWIIKTDASGNIQWQNTIGGSAGDLYSIVRQTSDGGYILGGSSGSNISGDKSEDNNGGTDYWILKVDASGVIQWQNTIGGSSDEQYLFSIEQTMDGGYILGGSSKSSISGDKTEINQGDWDYWFLKTDSTGSIQWQNTIGGTNDDRLQSVKQSVDNGYILLGVSLSSISGDKTDNSNGAYDYWIVKTDSAGVIIWQNSIGGNGWDMGWALDAANDGTYLIGGWSHSNISGDKTDNCVGIYDYWIAKVTEEFNVISGSLFIDANINNILDPGEIPLVNKMITVVGTGRINFAMYDGQYVVSVLNSGNYSVYPITLNYYNAVPLTHSASFTGIQQTDSLNDFAFQPAGVFNDLCVVSTPMGPLRAGFDASYLITYENVGTTTLNPTVIFYPDNDLSFVSATPSATTVAIDSLVWNFGPLSPFQTGSILVTVNVNVGTPIGTLINSGAVIEPIANDANTQCNQSFWEVFTTGSYDPNDILVDQDTLLTTQFPNPPYLEYIIRFQNTGNDTAFTAKILNPIDTFKLELNTFEFVASSHPMNISWIPWERNMQFQFDNILLPDSNVNEPASHGFVRYRIKPRSTLTLGDTIPNFAAIYFDFNAPVITNTAVTHIVLPTFLSETTDPENLLLFPNPAHATLTIKTGNFQSGDYQLTISDVAGRTLLSKPILGTAKEHTIDISSFSRGIYFVQLQAGEFISRGRFVKE